MNRRSNSLDERKKIKKNKPGVICANYDFLRM